MQILRYGSLVVLCFSNEETGLHRRFIGLYKVKWELTRWSLAVKLRSRQGSYIGQVMRRTSHLLHFARSPVWHIWSADLELYRSHTSLRQNLRRLATASRLDNFVLKASKCFDCLHFSSVCNNYIWWAACRWKLCLMHVWLTSLMKIWSFTKILLTPGTFPLICEMDTISFQTVATNDDI